jgi:hypothetical protein
MAGLSHMARIFPRVVPAKAGIHSPWHCLLRKASAILPKCKRHGVWVPAFAGTTRGEIAPYAIAPPLMGGMLKRSRQSHPFAALHGIRIEGGRREDGADPQRDGMALDVADDRREPRG